MTQAPFGLTMPRMGQAKSKRKKQKVSKAGVRVRTYEVLSRAVDEGISYGYRRAHKHDPNPSEQAIKDAIELAVMGSICEVFSFDEEEGQ